MVRKNVRIRLFVLKTEPLNDATMSVYFERPVSFEYEAGDWIDLDFDGEILAGGRTYSLSSSPTEDELAITFRHGLSPFKRRLQSLQPGDEAYISQYGNDYGFHPKEHRSSLLIAGGIGIAPFRSMIKETYDTGSRSNLKLIYINKGADFVFAEAIESWKKKLPQLQTVYVDSSELGRKKRDLLLMGALQKTADQYFIAGPPAMVESTKRLLLDTGLSARDIRIDSFGGY